MSALWWFLLACSQQVKTDSSAQISVQHDSKAREMPAVSKVVEGAPASEEPLLHAGWKNRILAPMKAMDRPRVQEALQWALDNQLGIEFDDDLVSAALRFGNPGQLQDLQRQRGRPRMDFLHPVVEQVAELAEQGQADWPLLEEAIGACQLLDNRPTRGLQQVAIPVSEHLAVVATELGAQQVVWGRAIRPGDRKGLEGADELICREMVWMRRFDFTVRLPRLLVFVAVDSEGPLYISIRPEDGAAFAFSSNHQSEADRLLEAGLWWDVAGDGREERVHEVFGSTYR